MTLRPYQNEALARRTHRELTVLPTGTGKTKIMAEIAAEASKPVAIVVHREELVDQTVRALRERCPKRRIGVVQGTRNEWREITVCMQQTLRRRLSSIPAGIGTLLVDEAHRYTTKTSGADLIDAFPEARVYGFTATPQINGKPIYGPGRPWVGISYRRSPVAMIREGYLCDVRALSVEWSDLDLSRVKVSKGDYSASALGSAMGRLHAPERIVDAWKEHAADRKRTLVFVPTVELGKATTAAFRATGAAVREVYGNTPPQERKSAISAIRTGAATVLVNVLVGAEGFDVPEIDCVVQARPTKSWTLYVQTIGRGLRIAPGKPDLLVLDIAGSSAEHDLATLPRALEIPSLPRGKSVREVTEDRAPREIELEYGAAVLQEALLYAPVHWNPWHEEYVACFDQEHVVVIAPVEREDAEMGYGVFQTNVRSGREQEIGVLEYPTEAQEIAEEHIRAEGDAKLFRRSAKWRTMPPTQAQIRWFRDREVPATRGEASEAITLALYRKIRRAA